MTREEMETETTEIAFLRTEAEMLESANAEEHAKSLLHATARLTDAENAMIKASGRRKVSVKVRRELFWARAQLANLENADPATWNDIYSPLYEH